MPEVVSKPVVHFITDGDRPVVEFGFFTSEDAANAALANHQSKWSEFHSDGSGPVSEMPAQEFVEAQGLHGLKVDAEVLDAADWRDDAGVHVEDSFSDVWLILEDGKSEDWGFCPDEKEAMRRVAWLNYVAWDAWNKPEFKGQGMALASGRYEAWGGVIGMLHMTRARSESVSEMAGE